MLFEPVWVAFRVTTFVFSTPALILAFFAAAASSSTFVVRLMVVYGVYTVSPSTVLTPRTLYQ